MAKREFSPVIEELKNPPPPTALFKSFEGSSHRFFLDSATDYNKRGRRSFLGCEPYLVFKSKKDSVSLEWRDGGIENFKSNPFLALKDIFKRYNNFYENDIAPFISGGVGYFSYDLKDYIERLPDIAIDDLDLPDCIFCFYDVLAIYDNLKGKVYVASSGLPETEPKRRSRRAKYRLKEFKDRITCGSSIDLIPFSSRSTILKSNFSKISYLETIEKAKGYIRKGDIYQVNLSQRFEAELDIEPFELYSRLKTFSPAPFSSYLDFGDVIVLSSSPERFLLKRGDHIETRPIKGTRPRGGDPSIDAALERELLLSRKDRAEHVMIVDLERNDLGRICEYGSVSVSESIILEKYSTVFHLVSTVQGTLRKEIDPIDCLSAAFPGGSITGAPKIRAMEIIEELEPVKRSIYTGAIGYIDFNGNMDTSIVIRTILIKDRKAYFQVGGGIVADSDPEKEYDETLDKAKAMMQALGVELRKEDFIRLRRKPRLYKPWMNATICFGGCHMRNV